MPEMQPRLSGEPTALNNDNGEPMQANSMRSPVVRDEDVTLVGHFRAFRGLHQRQNQHQPEAAGSADAPSPDRPPSSPETATDLKGVKNCIDNIAPSVRSVKAAFEKVDVCMRSLASKRLRDPRVSELKDLEDKWKAIKKSYNSVLRDSSEIAIQGATTIKDFTSSVMPFLQKDESEVSLEEKLAELEKYVENIRKDGQHARDFSSALQQIREDLTDFKSDCTECKKFLEKALLDAISKLEAEIKKLDSSVQKLKRAFSFVRGAKKREEITRFHVPTEVQARRAKLDELQGEKALVNREANEIEKNVDIVHKEAGLLVTVWNLIENDIQYVKSQLGFCLRSAGSKILQTRVLELEVRYRTLHDCLRDYASALSQADASEAAETTSSPRNSTGFGIAFFTF